MNQFSALPDAVARIRGDGAAAQLLGTVEFYQRRGAVLVTARITGLPDTNPTGFYAFHIHQGDRCEGPDFASAMAHFDLGNHPHPMHSGDLPPLLSCGGRAYMQVLTCRFTVREILGRTVIIHSGPDDFHSQPAGNSGTRLACGKIVPAMPEKTLDNPLRFRHNQYRSY